MKFNINYTIKNLSTEEPLFATVECESEETFTKEILFDVIKNEWSLDSVDDIDNKKKEIKKYE